MDKEYYSRLLEKFKDVRVMAVGDIYLDENIFGSVTEVSLEAPIPVFEVHEKRHNPGAAGNAACNAASLGGRVTMVGVVGDDVNAGIVKREFAARGVDTSGIVTDPARATNTYGKLKAGGHNIPMQEVLRTDTPKPKMVSGAVEAAVIAKIRELAPKVDAVLLGDQASATISDAIYEAILDCARQYKLVTVADSRARAGFFRDVDVIKPNDREAGLAAGIEVVDDATLEQAGRFLLTRAKNALVTLGPKGITVFAADGSIENVPIRPVRAVDVTGAGDTVAAAIVLTLAAGGTLRDAAVLGNTAAGIAVVQEGVVTVSNAELRDAVLGPQGPEKLKSLEQLRGIAEKLRRDGKKVVWTNGCFDLLHAGHITYLLNARALGDVMVVGLNSDASVRENKGPDRPVVCEMDRALVLSALECVDYVVLFDGKTPMPLIEVIQPDIYAKGGDYTLDTLVQEERRLVEGYGGSIAIIPGREGKSTTGLINQISGKG
ncbi:MAG: D-glycero-beta-D-manno-heptose 1-phosphate adenylyltransferase [Candidatus Hydrogenedentes bacterium]|nr:D-glycero-beta-D-manno-heptose 1-phosphate adenylyltransferase [Candidatus Hydrogenedentota bacterium]